MLNKLILVRGLPGSGKSTYAKQYFSSHIHLEADMYFVQPDGSYDWIPERLGKAHNWCQESAKIFLSNGLDVVVSNTFTTRKELEPYVNFAILHEIPYGVFRLNTQYESIHAVPQDVIEKMRNRFEDFEDEVVIPWGK
jgi:tRNA uridine 5-carbamoylmethylation protein Kti12